MSRKTAMAALEALCDRAENDQRSTIGVTYGFAFDVITLDVADVRAIITKARAADRVNASRSGR